MFLKTSSLKGGQLWACRWDWILSLVRFGDKRCSENRIHLGCIGQNNSKLWHWNSHFTYRKEIRQNTPVNGTWATNFLRKTKRGGCAALAWNEQFSPVSRLTMRDCDKGESDRRGSLRSKQRTMGSQTRTLISSTGEFTFLAFRILFINCWHGLWDQGWLCCLRLYLSMCLCVHTHVCSSVLHKQNPLWLPIKQCFSSKWMNMFCHHNLTLFTWQHGNWTREGHWPLWNRKQVFQVGKTFKFRWSAEQGRHSNLESHWSG